MSPGRRRRGRGGRPRPAAPRATRAGLRGQGAGACRAGEVEHGETLVEATVRELREETGLDGVCGPLIDWGEFFEGDHHAS